MKNLLFGILVSQLANCEEILDGSKQEIVMPLSLEKAIGLQKRPEKMKLTYWTSLYETKECLKSPFKCDISEYQKYFIGEIEFKNVDVSKWINNRDTLEIRLAMNQHDVEGVKTYDILKFTYKWDKN